MKITVRRIEHVQIVVPVGQINAARRFYLELLTFEEVPMPDSFKGVLVGFWCQNNGVMIHVGEDPETRRTKAHPAFEIENVKGVRKYIEGLGIQTFDEPFIPHRERFSFRDPFNNRIEFLEIVS